MSMADCFTTAMFLPKEYGKLVRMKAGKTVAYFALLLFLCTVIQFVIPTAGAIAGMGGLKGFFLNHIPKFSLEGGELTYESKDEKTMEDMDLYWCIDTDVEAYKKEDVPTKWTMAILISKTNMLIYNKMAVGGGLVEEYPFSLYKDVKLNNQMLADGAFGIYIGLGFVFLFLYVVEIIQYLLMGLFYAGMMYLFIRSLQVQYPFGNLYKIALFAGSIGILVASVTICLNIPILMVAGDVFRVFVTVYIMNRVMIRKEKNEAL